MRQLKRRHFTLIEMLISLTLTMLAITALTFFYYQIEKIDTIVEEKKEKEFLFRHLQGRLATILPKAIAPPNSSLKTKSAFYFATGSGGPLYMAGSPYLLFSYEAEANLETDFTGPLLARLFLTPEGSLTLAEWPFWDQWEEGAAPPMRREVLLEKVTKLAFYFYVAPELSDTKTHDTTYAKPRTGHEMKPLPKRGDWLPYWHADFFRLPVMVRMEVSCCGEEEPQLFLFPLPNNDMPIIYSP